MKSLLSRELCTFITNSCSVPTPAPDPAQRFGLKTPYQALESAVCFSTRSLDIR